VKNRIFAMGVILVLVLSIIPGCASASKEITTEYEPDFETVFSNPERSFHSRYEIIDDPAVNKYVDASKNIDGFNSDATDRTFSRAKNKGNTLIHSYIHLDMFTETDQLPQALLDNLASGLDATRDAGLKITVRPAYTWEKPTLIPEERILAHIEQINAVISDHADVIMYLQAGYLGNWGEWHEWHQTLPPANQYYGESEFAVRYRIIQKILKTTPDSIPLAMRYPNHLRQILEGTPEGETPLTTAQKDRLGFHNDSFLAGFEDCGTYGSGWWDGQFSLADKRQWMVDMKTSQGFNTLFGGETQDMNQGDWDDANGIKLQEEMFNLNCTEINEDYSEKHIVDIWMKAALEAEGNDPAESAYTRVKRKMGYRLRLIDATYGSVAKTGKDYALSFNIDNDGYAGIIKERPMYVVFESLDGAVFEAVALPDVEVRSWVGGDIYAGPYAVLAQTITVPEGLAAGKYKLGLWLPDAAEGLQNRPEYSVRFANLDIWNADRGYNELGTITVKK